MNFEKKERKRLNRIESFFEDDDLLNNFTDFERTFKEFKAQTKDGSNVYILDELTDEQKQLFKDKYSYANRGGGTYYSKEYCNDNEYRMEYRFKNNLILMSKGKNKS